MNASYSIIAPDAKQAVKQFRRKARGINDLGTKAGIGRRATMLAGPRSKVGCRRGWTAIEIVVMVLVVGFLILLAAPWMLSRREASRRTQCERRFALIAEALQRAEQNNGFLPGFANPQADDSAGQTRPTGWVFPILPFLDARGPDGMPNGAPPWLPVFVKYGPSGPDSTRGAPPDVRIPLLVCPADPAINLPRPSMSSVAVNCGRLDRQDQTPADWPANGVFLDRWRSGGGGRSSLAYVEKHDGLEHTLLLMEKTEGQLWTDHQETQQAVVWVEQLEGGQRPWGKGLLPINQQAGQSDGSLKFARPSSGHPGGVNVAFADGRVVFLGQNIDYVALVHQMTSNIQDVRGQDGERLGPPIGLPPDP